MFFGGWHSLFRIILVGIPTYLSLIILLRISGKRTLSKFNAFDFVITVAFGSVLASALLVKDQTLVDIVVALALLVLLQFLITWTTVRWPAARRLVKAEPTLLYHRGHFLEDAMRRERLAKGELLAAVREAGYADVAQIQAVVLETDGSVSVISHPSDGPILSD